ncbi:MAG: YihY/virulence factor BrkB family protein [Treponema sp.]|nr:YihY/virulence factor BrkB family protein [Treponema sp.]
MKQHTAPIRLTKYTIGQLIYLSSMFYIQNNLYTCAAACTFSFFFSIIPIGMMTLSILVRIGHAYPEIITTVVSYLTPVATYVDIDAFIAHLMQHRLFNWVDIVIAVFIFWMARKLFATVMQGIRLIFHHGGLARPIINQLLIFSGEIVFITVAVIIIIGLFAFRLFFTLSIFSMIRERLEWLFSTFSFTVTNAFSYLLILIFVTLVYKFASGTKPSFKLSFISSLLCTAVFFIVSKLMGLFLNVANYNLIYGVLGSIMILLLEMYIFFMIFLWGAQLIYVTQFFNTLLIGELYLLPDYETTDFVGVLRRILFISPDALMRDGNVIHCTAGTVIYDATDNSHDVYYIADGSVLVRHAMAFSYYERGDFFGELRCLLDGVQEEAAEAVTDSVLLRISADTFRSLIEKNPNTAEKALSLLSAYARKAYHSKVQKSGKL